MRIGFDAKVLTGEKCGAANYLCRLVQNLVKLRPQIEIYLFSPEKICVDYEPFLEHPQVRRVMPDLPKSQRREWPGKHLPGLLKEHKVDVFHQPFGADGPVFLPPCPTVVTIFDLTPWVVQGLAQGWQEAWRYKIRHLLWTRIASKVLTVSDCSKKDIVRLCHVSANHVVATLPGADSVFDGPIGAEEERTTLEKYHLLDKKYIVNISGLSHKRRHPDFILEGFSLFRRHAIQDTYLVFTGSVLKAEGFYERVARKAEMLGLKERVIITGFLSDKSLKVVLSNAQASVVTSLYEGFSLPITESFSCGVPVIANSRGAMPEISGDAAILADPYDPSGLADALKRVLEDSVEREKFIRKGYERAKAFSWEKMAMETLETYLAVMKK